jgi:ABC-2 type transport system permease protein
MEFRLDFLFRIIMDIIYYAVNIAFFKILYSHTALLGGWTESQIMIFVATYLVVDAINMTVFSNNMWWLPLLVNKGDLDYYLVRPVSSLFFVSVRDFAANSFLNLVIAVGIFIWSIVQYDGAFTFSQLLLHSALIINGTSLYYLMYLLFLMPVFWTHSSKGFASIFFIFARFMERPDRIYVGIPRLILTTVLPFTMIASFPSRLLLEGFSASILANILLVTTGVWVVVLYLWRFCLRAYSSASS